MPPKKKSFSRIIEYIKETPNHEEECEDDEPLHASKTEEPEEEDEFVEEPTKHLRKGYFHKDEEGKQIVALPPKLKRERTPKQIEAFNQMKIRQQIRKEENTMKKEVIEEKKMTLQEKRKVDRIAREKLQEEMELQNDLEFEDTLVRKAIAVKKRQIRRKEVIETIPDYDEPPVKELPTSPPIKEMPKYIFL